MADVARTVAGLRTAVGLGLLLRPAPVARLLAAPEEGAHPVLRVLGARHLLVGATGLARSTREVASASAAVDGLHVLSCLAFAAVSPLHRRTALRASTTATAWLAVTWLSRPQR